MIRFLFLVFMLFTLMACGGGGGVSPGSLDPPITMPDPGPIDPLPFSPTLITRTGPSAADVTDYLYTHASGGPWRSSTDYTWSHDPGLVRFTSPPTVRMARTATDHERALTQYAIGLINRALPYEHHLRMGADAPTGIAGEWQDGLPNIPDGEIVVEFISGSPQGGRPGSEAISHQNVQTEYDTSQARWEKTSLRAASVEMDRRVFGNRPDHQMISVLVHETLHALGLQGHVSGEDFPDSNMYDAWAPITGGLPAIDAAGLQALYLRLDEKTDPEDVSPDSLGPWSQESSALIGQLGGISFGVTHQNNVSQPWTAGRMPDTDLADNTALRGTVTWEGGLVGFAPDQASVVGGSTLTVNLATLSGRAEFTDLQAWSAGTTPRTLGLGSTWGDGTLEYDIAISGNFVRSTGGDDGILSGTFYGPSHEGVAGSLQRSDLTAAFGANRQ